MGSIFLGQNADLISELQCTVVQLLPRLTHLQRKVSFPRNGGALNLINSWNWRRSSTIAQNPATATPLSVSAFFARAHPQARDDFAKRCQI